MKSKNIKLLFLTGTPIINSPFELSPCFNMLIGKEFFPENEIQFNNWFIDDKKNIIKNKNKLSNYLTGRVSYYGSKYFNDNSQNQDYFPKDLPIIIEEVNMSSYQYNIYNGLRLVEKTESLSSGFDDSNLYRFSTDKKKSSTTYRIKTRQASNFVFPKNIRSEINERYNKIKKIKDKKQSQKMRKSIKKDIVNMLEKKHINLDGLKEFSPKMLKIIENINKEIKNGKDIGLVYYEFVTGEGIGIFKKILLNIGWKEFDSAT